VFSPWLNVPRCDVSFFFPNFNIKPHFMKYLFVYILLCSDDSYYVGVTNDLERRLMEHQEGEKGSLYTSKRLPVQLVYSEKVHGPLTAIKREKQLKTWSRAKKEALIAGREEELKRKAKKKFPPPASVRSAKSGSLSVTVGRSQEPGRL
jgi:putative endonuclease